jgi:transposase
MSRDELVVLVRRQAGQIAELREANEALAGRLARVEHLLSRNSANSSRPPSKDGELGRTPPPEKPKRRGEAGAVPG